MQPTEEGSSAFTESLRSAIQEFKLQQEKYSLFLSKTTTERTDRRSENNLNNILNVECVLMPSCSVFTNSGKSVDRMKNSPLQKMWPMALLAQYSTNTTRMGFIEEHGTLWKLVQKRDQYPGFRVILQASEIEEKRKFLGPDLQLVPKEIAAVWNIKIANKYQDGLSSKNPNGDAERGLFIHLEAVGTVSKGVDASKLLADETLIRSDTSLLTFKNTDLVNRSEVILDSLPLPSFDHDVTNKESNNRHYHCSVDGQGLEVYRSFVWEVIPDSWISNDLGFLEEFVDK